MPGGLAPYLLRDVRYLVAEGLDLLRSSHPFAGIMNPASSACGTRSEKRTPPSEAVGRSRAEALFEQQRHERADTQQSQQDADANQEDWRA
jgi:hypothetical protein